jgi:hypothetical protein
MTEVETLKKSRLAMALAILWRNGLPQPLARLFAPIPNGIRHHLARLAAEGNPNPGGVGFFEYKRPQLKPRQDLGDKYMQYRLQKPCPNKENCVR